MILNRQVVNNSFSQAWSEHRHGILCLKPKRNNKPGSNPVPRCQPSRRSPGDNHRADKGLFGLISEQLPLAQQLSSAISALHKQDRN